MLPTSYRQSYQEFTLALQKLQQNVADLSSPPTSADNNFQQVKQVFQSQIMSLTSDGMDCPTCINDWQSLQTEIHRTFKLLETDMMFLRVSRQAATSRHRQAAIRDRVNQLIRYCQVLLQ